jgi:hypothetical protein
MFLCINVKIRRKIYIEGGVSFSQELRASYIEGEGNSFFMSSEN